MKTELQYDVGIIGAGPAGLAAVNAAAEAGLSVLLVDAAAQPGGQYWRHPDEEQVPETSHAGQHGWRTFKRLRAGLYTARDAGRLTYLPNTQVWLIDRPGNGPAGYNLRLTSLYASAPPPASLWVERLILCTGGYDRQLPVPGWDLPGVMAAGGVQALLKGSRTLAGRRAVVAGTGPFLLPVATGLAEAGVEVKALCEAGALRNWLPHLGAAARVPAKGIEGALYAALLAKHRIRYQSRTIITRIHGQNAVQAVTLARADAQGRPAPGTSRTVEADLVALGWGFTPSLELPLMVGVGTRRDIDGSLVAVVDQHQRSDVSGVYIAGEATGVGGALTAVAEGQLAGWTVAGDSGRPVRAAVVRRLRKTLGRHRTFAAAMHSAHPVPSGWAGWLSADTTVCRCEEVSYGELCAAHDELGAQGPRTLKMLARPGMGWCQGRVCGYATAELAAGLCGRHATAEDLRAQSARTPAAPVSLAELAAMEEHELDEIVEEA